MLGKNANQTGTREDKWNQPGWRIEQRYSNKVLIGNWAEERLPVSSFKKQFRVSQWDEMEGTLCRVAHTLKWPQGNVFTAFDSNSGGGSPVCSIQGPDAELQKDVLMKETTGSFL